MKLNIYLPVALSISMGWNVTFLLLAGILFSGALRRRYWGIRIVGYGALLYVLTDVLLQQLDPTSATASWLKTLSIFIMPTSVAVFLWLRSGHDKRKLIEQRDELERTVSERTKELRMEKERSDELLLNILPMEIAEELKANGHAKAKHFDNATILFTDFKGFTEASEKLSPQELVEELNTCFKAFDAIITARGIEKIKTIGDAYMCVGGLPDPKTSSPADVVHAGLEMQAFMIARKALRDAQGVPAFEMRVGIHTGPVVAGIVGVKKFQYDIWGDTVNTASRMESSGAVEKVNISEATYELVRDTSTLPTGHAGPLGTRAFKFTPRGKVQAKGKGEMEMYFVS